MLLSKLDKASREQLSQLLQEKNQSQCAEAVLLQHVLCMVCYVSPVLGLGVPGVNGIKLQAEQ